MKKSNENKTVKGNTRKLVFGLATAAALFSMGTVCYAASTDSVQEVFTESDEENYEALKATVKEGITVQMEAEKVSINDMEIEELTDVICNKIIEDYLQWAEQEGALIGIGNADASETDASETDAEETEEEQSEEDKDEENYQTLLDVVESQVKTSSLSADQIDRVTEEISDQVIGDYLDWVSTEAYYLDGFSGIEGASDEENYNALLEILEAQISKYSFSDEEIKEMSSVLADQIIADYLNWMNTEAQLVGWNK